MRIAIIGATAKSHRDAGILLERQFPADDVRFFGSARSAGSTSNGTADKSPSKTPTRLISRASTSP